MSTVFRWLRPFSTSRSGWPPVPGAVFRVARSWAVGSALAAACAPGPAAPGPAAPGPAAGDAGRPTVGQVDAGTDGDADGSVGLDGGLPPERPGGPGADAGDATDDPDVGDGAPPAGPGSLSFRQVGALRYGLYRPPLPTGAPPVPLVLALHGCSQGPASFAAESGLSALAAREGFVVAYPEQTVLRHPQRCWRWYRPEHQRRGAGEPAELIDIVDDAIGDPPAGLSIDPARIFVVGFSAGAALANALAVTYPDRFRGAFLVAGLPYAAAASSAEAAAIMASGVDAPETLGPAAWSAMGEAARAVPVFVLQGDADWVVQAENGRSVVRQWVDCTDLVLDGTLDGDVVATPVAASPAEGGVRRASTRIDYVDPSGDLVVRHVEVAGLGHAWPGAQAAGLFADPLGPSAADWLVEFFFGP